MGQTAILIQVVEDSVDGDKLLQTSDPAKAMSLVPFVKTGEENSQPDYFPSTLFPA